MWKKKKFNIPAQYYKTINTRAEKKNRLLNLADLSTTLNYDQKDTEALVVGIR